MRAADLAGLWRERLDAPEAATFDRVPATGDYRLNGGRDAWPELYRSPTPAAVLALIIDQPDPQFFFTTRAAHLKRHAGQISFPGGRVETGDKTLADTALRETEEEVGLPRHAVDLVGSLAPYDTGSGYRITTLVGVTAPFEPKLDPGEVEDSFLAPVSHFLNPDNHKVSSMHFKGRERFFYEMPWQDRRIWGVTAGLLRTLYERVA